MSYTIEPMPIVSFLADNKMKLPRFQRKSTWDDKQRFELCISVFQEYPVGVVIVNKDQKTSWLLDGRQRRTTLQMMRNNPVAVYEWARAYIKFKKNEDEFALEKMYWETVDKYLEAEPQEETKAGQDNDSNVDYYGDDENDVENTEEEENSFDSKRQRQGLKTLLDIILMVHQNKPSGSQWERLFDFKSIKRLRYAQKGENRRINPEALRKFLLELDKECEQELDGELTQKSFIEYYVDNFDISEDDLKKFKMDVEKHWDKILNSIDVIRRSEKILSDARIGIIWLTNATPLDAQNIFSRINKGGTQLKAEELLSAKPYWNVEVSVTNNDVISKVEHLYKKLGVSQPENIVRWDLAATLISRVDVNNLIFPTYKKAKENNEISLDEITMGFKLISSIYQGGMSAKNVIDLEKSDAINWTVDIDELVDDINTVCKILLESSFFRCFVAWKKPMADLLGSAIALEFITIVYEDWKSRNKPTVASAELKALQRDAVSLFDRLVFEYGTKAWRGSGDSKMANDIKIWRERVKPIAKEEWLEFINNICGGTYNGQNTTVKALTPALYHYYCLSEIIPLNEVNTTFEVDHIIPKERFVDNSMVKQCDRDSFINLALLPKKDNISKKNKALSELSDSWLKKSIVAYTGIQESDFDKYSDIVNIGDMRTARQKLYEKAFDDYRKSVLSK